LNQTININEDESPLQAQPKKSSKVWIFALAFLLIAGGALGYYFLNNSLNSIIGVQLMTSKGTLLIGNNKYNKQISIWKSPQTGWFEKDGKPNFFQVKTKKDKVSQKNWEIVWEWDEMYKVGSKEPLIQFARTQQDKEAAIDTLSSLCKDKNDESMSCNWNVTNKIFIEALTPRYLCVSDLSGEFYGGAHPIALRRFGTYDLTKKKFVRFSDLIPDAILKDQIWTQLHDNIKNVMDQSMISQDDVSSLSLAGGVDTLEDPTKMPGADANANEVVSPEQKLTSLLSSQGYSFSPNVFCPIVRPEGPALLFGFPHSEQVNRGLNFKAEALLNGYNLPKDVQKIFDDYRFAKSKNPKTSGVSVIASPDSSWQISQKLGEVNVFNKENQLTVTLPKSSVEEETSEDLLGVFWIYKSPSIASLGKYKFTEIKLPKGQNKISLN
jgi:hypothetical protein